MNRSTRLCLAAVMACVPAAWSQQPTGSLAALRAGFQNPPNEARPMVRWWWFGPAVVKPEILRELQQMKAGGIGGAELAFVYPEVLDDPAKNLKNLAFLSPEMLDAVRYAQDEGRKLGLRIDVTLCSGWPYGGPAIPLAQAVTRLRTVETPVEPGATTVASPRLAEGEKLLGAALVEGTPNPPARRGPPPATPPSNQWNAGTSKPLPLGAGGAASTFAAADKPRVALFFIQGHTRQEVKRAAVGAEGFVLDPFSHDAVATHLKSVGEPLLSAFGSTPPYAIFSDSLEAYGADWTPELPAEFQKRRGYDLMQHLPELVGGGSPAADKVRHDYGKTLTELVDENYLTQINAWAKAHGTKFRSQTYGEPAVNFSSENLVALAEGEGPQWRQFSTLRWATSANHVFGHNVTSGETFTWLHSPVFRATPLDMKAEADIDFIMGENQLIFHGWPYSPPRMPDGSPEVPEPGWSLYAAAVFNDHNPWWPVEHAVNDYIARLSFLMRAGEPANQVAVLLPEDDAWASFAPGHTTMTGALAKLVTPELMSTVLSAGYNVDFISAEAIDTTGLGTHQVLVIPPTDRIPVATLRKVEDWVLHHGGKAISVGRAPTLDNRGEKTAELAKLLEPLPFVPDYDNMGRALKQETQPDFELKDADDAARRSVGFVRRKLADADVYYVVNTGNTPVAAHATFASRYNDGARWNPETGAPERTVAPVRRDDVALKLAPYESAVYVFGAGAGAAPLPHGPAHELADLSAGWNIRFGHDGKDMANSALTDWTANPQTLHFSGEAVYTRSFNLRAHAAGPVFLEVGGGEALPGAPNSATPEHDLLPNGLPNPLVTRTGPGMHAFYEPPVRAGALVYVNGKYAGALWHPPYRLDVSDALRPGDNRIEIRVYNTALNAWSAEAPRDYGPLKAKYGDRFQMQDLDRVKPVPSGIVGTVKLVELEGAK